MFERAIKSCADSLRPIFGWRRRHQVRAFLTGHDNPQWGRIVMDRETERLVRTLPHTGFDVLEISGNKWASFGFKSYRDVGYPGYDLCKEPLPQRFDLIVAEQVFEHLLWPYRALRNLEAMLRPGGYVLLTTPFLVCIHPTPEDCTRWSEVGLRYFMAECGFPLEQTVTGAWGNRACVIANLNGGGHNWAPYIPWRHSLRNDPDFPIHVWALGRKADAISIPSSDPGPREMK